MKSRILTIASLPTIHIQLTEWIGGEAFTAKKHWIRYYVRCEKSKASLLFLSFKEAFIWWPLKPRWCAFFPSAVQRTKALSCCLFLHWSGKMLLLLLSCSCYQPVNGCSSFSLVASFPLASKGLLEQRLVATQNFADGRIREWQKSLEPLSISSSNCHPLGDPILILLSQKRTEEEKKKKKNFANCYPATLTTKRGKTIWNPSRFISTPSG